MSRRVILLALCASFLSSLGIAQSAEPYEVPRTEYGQPDFQGVWGTRFSTMLERPEGLPPSLPPDAAAGFAQAVAQVGEGTNTDPDIERFGAPVLAVVGGEHRTSVIVYPENGQLPYNEAGLQRSSHGYFDGRGYDGPEQRPGTERCIEGWGSPPMRAFMYQLYHGIVQTADTVSIMSEEVFGHRSIYLNGESRPEALKSFEGHSIGHWEGDTLVVEITQFSDVNPERATIGRPMLISSEATVTERFTRTSHTELNYKFRVEDPVYYTEPWEGEFSFIRDEGGHIYEYACHEGNYSMTGALRGERFLESEAAKNK